MIKRTLLVYEKTITDTKGESTLSEDSTKQRNITFVTDMSDLVTRVDSLFSFQVAGHSEVKMDYETWEKILSALPDDYTIPDPRIFNRMKQHLTDHNIWSNYNKIPQRIKSSKDAVAQISERLFSFG